MRHPNLSTFGLCTFLASIGSLSLATASFATASFAEEPRDSSDQRWLPEACVLVLEVEHASQAIGDGHKESDEARWNRFYRLGIAAIQSEELGTAEARFCQALEAAANFGPSDIRFAETLDELGLVNYLNGDAEGAEAMQGAATAEMLLALGPPTANLTETAEKSCRSSVASYMVRLGWIFERQGRGDEIDLLLQSPYRILERGYVPTGAIRDRLDGLIAQYLLLEDYAAADWLSALGERLH